MLQAFERPTVKYKLIYVYSIDDPAHSGYLKIGEATIASDLPPDNLPPDCKALNDAAHDRIKQETCTAAIEYHLEYTELAVRFAKLQGGMILPESFSDKAVHQVLKHSGIPHKFIGKTKGREWFALSLTTAKNAIAAVKAYKPTLNARKNEEAEPTKIVLRDEQKAAIKKTIERFKVGNTMLWDAKMRFGKTLTTLQLIKEGGYKSVLIATHRPVVKNGWQEDFYKLFKASDGYEFFYKDSLAADYSLDAKIERKNDKKLEELKANKDKFIYFASIQDLRGSQVVGGNYAKNVGVFNHLWDLVVIDEAHEGTETELGESVRKKLLKKHTKVLSLSGTPFNILGKFDEDSVFVWDYVMEQKTKDEWTKKHPDEPNPYASLPRMNIYTYNLGEALGKYEELDLDGKAFNFREFFRTWTGDKQVDGSNLPKGAKIDDFVHESDVIAFLDLISQNNNKSAYPYSTEATCNLFKHTLWMVPGVKSARALSGLLRKHPFFGAKVGNKLRFGIANVAGEGDDYEDSHQTESLELVRKTIREHECSITLSCGRLTTGVTVKEWTGVLMLAGSVNTAASSYMQTIFRVQSPGEVDGKVKTDCYVFDFAPDRTLNVLATASRMTSSAIKSGKSDANDSAALGAFLNYCPVISISGTKMEPFNVERMMGAIKRVFIMQAIKSGFDDDSIYNQKKLQELKEKDIEKFEALRKIIGTTKQAEKATSVIVNTEGFDNPEQNTADTKRPKSHIDPDPAALERKRKREQAKHAASILRAISIRIPMLIYGADVPSDKVIKLEEFIDLVDNESWLEFMPAGVTKKIFKDFIPYYDADVVGQAGLEYRKLAKLADKLSPTERIKQIALIFDTFRNPDKETVLTPWNVVNRHLSDAVGGWTFFDERFKYKEPLDNKPRYVDKAEVTDNLFGKKNSKILEINSKSGLYPLYVAYSIYRSKCGEISDDAIDHGARIEKWREVLRDNIFVVCKTPMAVAITRRTLAGYDTMAKVNAVYYKDIVTFLKDEPEKFVKDVRSGKFWKREENEMKFDAVVGNPPYQQNISETGAGNDSLSKQIFPDFIKSAIEVDAKYVSLITPSRWFTADAQDRSFIKLREYIKTHNRYRSIWQYAKSKMLFPNVEIAGGVNYFLYDSSYEGDVNFNEMYEGKKVTAKRPLFEKDLDIVISMKALLDVVGKVVGAKDFVSMMTMTLGRNAFGIVGKKSELDKLTKTVRFENSVEVRCAHDEIRYIKPELVTKNKALMNRWKVFTSKGNGGAGILGDDKPVSILGKPYLGGKNSICTDSLIPIGSFKTKEEAINLMEYMKTKFFRFMVGALKTSQNVYQNVYRFVPAQNFTKSWTDSELYAKYNLTKEEISLIEKMVRPME